MRHVSRETYGAYPSSRPSQGPSLRTSLPSTGVNARPETRSVQLSQGQSRVQVSAVSPAFSTVTLRSPADSRANASSRPRASSHRMPPLRREERCLRRLPSRAK